MSVMLRLTSFLASSSAWASSWTGRGRRKAAGARAGGVLYAYFVTAADFSTMESDDDGRRSEHNRKSVFVKSAHASCRHRELSCESPAGPHRSG